MTPTEKIERLAARLRGAGRTMRRIVKRMRYDERFALLECGHEVLVSSKVRGRTKCWLCVKGYQR